MINICKKYYIFNIYEDWFDYHPDLGDIFGLKCTLHIKTGKRVRFGIKKISYTVHIPLDRDPSQILASFPKNTRADIRKAEEENGITTYFHNDISGFVEFYNGFASKKKLPLVTYDRVTELGESLRLSYAIYNGEITAAHSYIMDKEQSIVRAFWSGTKRLESDTKSIIVGRANKYLHYKDMLYFKEQGINMYDFGGYAMNTKNEELVGVNNFKMKFGGEVVPCINYYSIGYILFRQVGKLFGLIG
jgi:hypothetical protein